MHTVKTGLSLKDEGESFSLSQALGIGETPLTEEEKKTEEALIKEMMARRAVTVTRQPTGIEGEITDFDPHTGCWRVKIHRPGVGWTFDKTKPAEGRVEAPNADTRSIFKAVKSSHLTVLEKGTWPEEKDAPPGLKQYMQTNDVPPAGQLDGIGVGARVEIHSLKSQLPWSEGLFSATDNGQYLKRYSTSDKAHYLGQKLMMDWFPGCIPERLIDEDELRMAEAVRLAEEQEERVRMMKEEMEKDPKSHTNEELHDALNKLKVLKTKANMDIGDEAGEGEDDQVVKKEKVKKEKKGCFPCRCAVM